jgi:MFS family permease
MSTTNPDAGHVQRNTVMFAFGGLLVAMFVGALDQTIMSTALPTVTGQLGGLSDLPWVVTVYVLAAAASTPLWGKTSDLYGRKNLLRAAVLVFIASSAVSGAAQSVGELIAFRAL